MAGTGPINLPLEHARTLLANSSHFQAWVGHPGDATATKAHITLYGEFGDNFSFPGASIFFIAPDTSLNAGAFAGGARNMFMHEGSMDICFEAVTSATYSGKNVDDWENAFVAFTNDIGGFIDDMENLAASDDYLDMNGWTVKAGPARTGQEDADDHIVMWIRINWRGKGY